jgi:beta-lactamase class A
MYVYRLHYSAMKKLRFTITILLFTLACRHGFAQHNALLQRINEIAPAAKGKLGVSISLLENGDTLNYNNDNRYVMHSVMKFPIAMAVLHEVDKGKLRLNQLIHLTKQDMQKTYSPIADKYPEGNIDMPVSELLSYMVSLSDNNACDILLKVLGGTQKVNRYVHSLGLKHIAIKASEQQMAAAWNVQYTNWCKPDEMIRLLYLFYKGTALKKTTNDFLWKIMLETSTGPNRIKGLLPAGTAVAHKTGTSPVDNNGLTPATNDIGIIILPNGKHLAISIFITDAYADRATCEKVSAEIARAAYDEFIK